MHRTQSGGWSCLSWHRDKKQTTSFEPSLLPPRFSQQMWTTCGRDEIVCRQILKETWQSRVAYIQSSRSASTNVPGRCKSHMKEGGILAKRALDRAFWYLVTSLIREQGLTPLVGESLKHSFQKYGPGSIILYINEDLNQSKWQPASFATQLSTQDWKE